MACAHGADVIQIHRPCLQGCCLNERLGAGRYRRLAAFQIGAGNSLLAQFDRSQRAMCMHGIDHVRVIGDIAFVPQVAFD